MEKVLILLRGVPGSGKSTEAQRIIAAAPEGTTAHFEADMYFCRNGEYEFNPKALPEAHGWCQTQTRAALLDPRIETVVVSNTFVKKWELDPYLAMALELGVKVSIRRMASLYTNVHGVSQDRIQIMLDKMEDIEGETFINRQ